jgi:hypothetical protein
MLSRGPGLRAIANDVYSGLLRFVAGAAVGTFEFELVSEFPCVAVGESRARSVARSASAQSLRKTLE